MKLFSRKNETSYSISQCANLILEYFFSERGLNSFTSDVNHDFPALRMDYTREFEDFLNYQKVELYLFNNITSSELMKIVEILSEKNVFNPQAKFIITGHSFTMELRKTFEKFNILYVIFLQTDTGYIYRFIPSTLALLKTAMCNENLTLSNIGDIEQEVAENIWKNLTLSLFYYKSPVYAMCTSCEKPGIEIETIKLLLKYFNITGTFQQTNIFDESRDWKNHDILFGTLVNAFTRKELDSTFPYIFDEAAFFVPVSFDIPRWKYILTAFPLNVWISWFSLSIMISFVWTITRIIDRNEGFLEVFASNLVFFLEQSQQFSVSLFSRKILLVSILLLSYNMNIFFKGRFTYLLDGVNHEHPGDTIEAIMQNKLDIGVSTRFIADLLNSTPEVRLYIEEHMVDCASGKLHGCMDRTITKRDMALLYPARKVRNKIKQFVDPYTGYPMLEQIDPSVASIPIVLAALRGNPFLRFFNEQLWKLRESGIIDMICKKYDGNLSSNEGTFLTEAKSLDFDHIVGPLIIWIFGCFSSFLLFLFEVYNSSSFIVST